MHALVRWTSGPGLAALLVITLAGCAAQGSRDLEIGDGQYLVRVAAAGQAGAALNHPAAIGADVLELTLTGLRFEEPGLLGRASSRPVFDQDEIARLAPALSRALARARADQRVDFMSLAGAGTNFGNSRKTEGTIFVDDDGRLNIALSAVRHVMTVDDDFTRFREISMGDPLSVDRAIIHLVWEREAFVSRRQLDGSPYPLWVLVANDPPRRSAGVAENDRQPERAATPAGRTAQPPPVSPPVQPEAAIIEESAPVTTEAVRARLEFLKVLHEDGLISDEDYDRERQRALRLLD